MVLENIILMAVYFFISWTYYHVFNLPPKGKYLGCFQVSVCLVNYQ